MMPVVRILLVSSSPNITTQVTTALLGEDVDLTEVRRPERALALLDDEVAFDIAVADADTAPTGGMALAREIKARAAMGRELPPIVLLIAREQDAYIARWSGADAWVLKPVDPFDLAEVVHALVDGRPVPRLPGVTAGGQPGAIAEAGPAAEVTAPQPTQPDRG